MGKIINPKAQEQNGSSSYYELNSYNSQKSNEFCDLTKYKTTNTSSCWAKLFCCLKRDSEERAVEATNQHEVTSAHNEVSSSFEIEKSHQKHSNNNFSEKLKRGLGLFKGDDERKKSFSPQQSRGTAPLLDEEYDNNTGMTITR